VAAPSLPQLFCADAAYPSVLWFNRGGLLGLTWAGLAPADHASLAWRLRSLDHLVGAVRNFSQRSCPFFYIGNVCTNKRLDSMFSVWPSSP
jgi:hypothetical protein